MSQSHGAVATSVPQRGPGSQSKQRRKIPRSPSPQGEKMNGLGPIFMTNKWRIWYRPSVGLRACMVSCRDLKSVEHAVEVTADSLYEAVAQELRVFRENDWIDEVGRGGQTTISVVVRQPEVQHKVRVQDFERWLESQGRTPAGVSLKARLRALLGKEVARAASETRNRNR
jgi:hypothetical protein